MDMGVQGMKYKLLKPEIRYHVSREIDLRDDIPPQSVPLEPGERLIREDGVEVNSGPSLDDALATVQDMLSDAQDAIQDVRDSHDAG